MSESLSQRQQDALRNLPAVEKLVVYPGLVDIARDATEHELVMCAREALAQERASLLAGEEPCTDEELCELVRERYFAYERRSLRSVINATGVVIHTNLGRSVLSDAAWHAVEDVACGYSTLEFDLEKGQRGSRHSHIDSLICELTGAEAACIVNNNAGAVMIVLSELAKGHEAIISRGELIEIGGSFRIPDIMALSGVKMVEVGTTNKTHLSDYENAINENTALILKVHPSNYRIRGFSETPSREDLVGLAAKHGLPVYEDQGSGVLIDITSYGLPYEPTVGSAISAGIDVVSCSGDKLLGGPQAGIITGSKELIARIKKNPLMRALRPDKMTLAGLEATLKATRDPQRAVRDIPTLRMLTMTQEELRRAATQVAGELIKRHCDNVADITVVDEIGRAGGGSLPDEQLPTSVIRIVPETCSDTDLADRLLHSGSIPIVTRVHEGAVCIDPRTLVSEDETAYVIDRIEEELQGAEF